MSKFALQARWVLPVETPPIEGGVVTVVEGKITSVATYAEPGIPIMDLGDVVLLPGLVNTHTHLEFSQLAKPLGEPGMSLPKWIELVIANRKQQVDRVAALAAGLQESLRAGVTTIGEIVSSNPALDETKPVSDWIAFQEVIGFSAARIDSVFYSLESCLELCAKTHQLGISPHAPYTVHPELVQRLVALAVKKQLPVAMHLAESPEELQLLKENSGPFRELLDARSMWDAEVFSSGLRPLDYLQMLSLAPRALVIHANYLDSEEIGFLAEHSESMSAIYCPRTHAYFEHAPYPLQRMLEVGVHVALGTDSRASNPDLSLLEEMRHVACRHSKITTEQILQLGTINGAKALGRDSSIGSLVKGKQANLIAVPLDHTSQLPLEAILFSNQQPQAVWLHGNFYAFSECNI